MLWPRVVYRRIIKMRVRTPGDVEMNFIEDENDSKRRTPNGLSCNFHHSSIMTGHGTSVSDRFH